MKENVLTDEIGNLQNEICNASGLTWEELFKNRRSHRPLYSEPRKVHIALLGLFIGLTWRKSAEVYNLNHAVMKNCLEKVGYHLQTDIEFREKYENVFRYALSKKKELANKLYLKWIKNETIRV
jgi:hypothetical protein